MERGIYLKTCSDKRADFWEKVLTENELKFEKHYHSTTYSSWTHFDIEPNDKISFFDLCGKLCIPNNEAVYSYTE